jgi:hypothetical protein
MRAHLDRNSLNVLPERKIFRTKFVVGKKLKHVLYSKDFFPPVSPKVSTKFGNSHDNSTKKGKIFLLKAATRNLSRRTSVPLRSSIVG